jgi:rhodanese-related sulfurtransferase
MIDAVAHFSRRLSFETDVSDVAAARAAGEPVTLLDARSARTYAEGHIAGAYNLPRPLTKEAVAELPAGEIITYCWGPACNGATKAALELARLGRPVREMLGGYEYWVRDGHATEQVRNGG